jgi:hypothetical protein
VPRVLNTDSALSALRSRMGDAAFQEACAWGGSIGGRRAVEFALDQGTRPQPVTRMAGPGDSPGDPEAAFSQRRRLRSRREASIIEADWGGSMIGRPRQGDMLVRSASAETIRNAPTDAARSRIRLSSQSGQSPTVCGGSVMPSPDASAISASARRYSSTSCWSIRTY